MSEISPSLVATVSAVATRMTPQVLAWTRDIAAVPAPTFDEADRAAFVRRLMEDQGLTPRVDDLHDVVGTVPGSSTGGNQPAVLLSAHLDTVFERPTPLRIRDEAGRIHGPGIGDNCVAIASVLALPQVLREAGIVPAVDLLLTGNVGEEGLGNLRGIKQVMADNPRIGAVVAVEGHNLGRVTHIAVGSKRLQVTATGPGGHSWGDFGRPSAIHALSRLIAELDAIPLSWAPKTTLNVGMVTGGVSVNSIAPTASCLVDMRSVDPDSLTRLAERVDAVIRNTRRDGIAFTVEEIGDRPAGEVSTSSPAVAAAAEILRALKVEPSYDASSTDANVAINLGLPSVCIGITSGGNVHREDEYIDTAPVATGLAQLALLAVSLAGAIAPSGH